MDNGKDHPEAKYGEESRSASWKGSFSPKSVARMVLTEEDNYYLEYTLANRYSDLNTKEFDILRKAFDLFFEIAITGSEEANDVYCNYAKSNPFLQEEDEEGNSLLGDLKRFVNSEILPVLESHGAIQWAYEIPVIKTVDDIKSLPPNIVAVHLASSSVLSKTGMRELIKRCPFLRLVQLRPVFRRIFSKASGRVLEDSGVKLVHRSRRPNYYKRFEFNRMYFDRDKRPWLERMETAGLPEFLVAKYYCSRSDITMEETAAYFNLSLEKARRLWNTFCIWMGYQPPRCYSTRYNLDLEGKLLSRERNVGK
ncbi:hypothetical protein A2982_03630 [candidate division WWE3 bacterium RIFCSPLOWO2_01_FULL_39_13]|uniref:Uncharacterized protein n=1 Tax=candidate division WWE3 bacterium RIFCSPLOWO2_01_FULL_39_13 TaxID=1802624 RepID=A0A1F4V2G4_UNCKA|nr:MAG: hypothetical protein A2982_03630 [candidate division WWE3 bacterium RIFCSPLOWO2_01_FULL_39_13]